MRVNQQLACLLGASTPFSSSFARAADISMDLALSPHVPCADGNCTTSRRRRCWALHRGLAVGAQGDALQCTEGTYATVWARLIAKVQEAWAQSFLARSKSSSPVGRSRTGYGVWPACSFGSRGSVEATPVADIRTGRAPGHRTTRLCVREPGRGRVRVSPDRK